MADLRVNKGFTLIQMSVIMTLAALVMVAILPSYQNPAASTKASTAKMNNIMNALRQYEVTNGNLPCPADPTLGMGNSNYGVAQTNGGTSTNCVNGSGSQVPYADTSKYIAIGMVPVKTLGLSYDAALDGYGRDISYVVDTSATACWASAALPGNITVNDNGIARNTVAALISHGADGFGAWIPKQGTGASNSGTRLNNGSTDPSQAANAEVTAGSLTALGGVSGHPFVSLVNQPANTTFDDLVTYKSTNFNINALPAQNPYGTVSTYPANGTYNTGTTLTFTLTFASVVTVTGTPYLQLTSYSGGVIGTLTGPPAYGNGSTIGYALYSSGSGTNTLTFKYIVGPTDNSNGIVLSPTIYLNGGTISGITNYCLFPPNLQGVILMSQEPNMIYVNDVYNGDIVEFDPNTLNYVTTIAPSGSGASITSYTEAIDSHGNLWLGTVTNANVTSINEYTSGGTLMQSFNPNAVTNTFPANGYASIGYPTGLTFDTFGNLWELDTWDWQVNEFNSTGTYLTSFLNPSGQTKSFANYTLTEPADCGPETIAFDSLNEIWITNTNACNIVGYQMGTSTSSFTGYITSGTLTVKTAPTVGSVQVGQTITGGTIPAGTTVTAAFNGGYTGEGGTGTYGTSIAGTYGSSGSPITMYASGVTTPNYIGKLSTGCGTGTTQFPTETNCKGVFQFTSTGPAAAAIFNATFSGTAMTVTSLLKGAIAVNQVLSGPGLAGGTYVVSGSGTSWVVSQAPATTLSGGYVITATTSPVFNGSISTAGVLTVSSMISSGPTIAAYQGITGTGTPSVGASTYITQIGGTCNGIACTGAGGTGTYLVSPVPGAQVPTAGTIAMTATNPVTFYVQDNNNAGTVHRIDEWVWTGTTTALVTNFNNTYTNSPGGIAFDPVTGNLWFGDLAGGAWQCDINLLSPVNGTYQNKTIATPQQCTTLIFDGETKIYYSR